jgi:hypothetical protein
MGGTYTLYSVVGVLDLMPIQLDGGLIHHCAQVSISKINILPPSPDKTTTYKDVCMFFGSLTIIPYYAEGSDEPVHIFEKKDLYERLKEWIGKVKFFESVEHASESHGETEAFLYHHPYNSPLRIKSKGSVLFNANYEDYWDKTHLNTHTMITTPGSSGGALFIKKEEEEAPYLVGIHTRALRHKGAEKMRVVENERGEQIKVPEVEYNAFQLITRKDLEILKGENAITIIEGGEPKPRSRDEEDDLRRRLHITFKNM